MDGGSRGNRAALGQCAIAVIICDFKGQVLFEKSVFLGLGSNNWAEYNAVIEGLTVAKNYTRNRVEVYSDSLLVVNQLNGLYQVKNARLKSLYTRVKELEKYYHKVSYTFVNRTHPMITRADSLLNRELDLFAKANT